MNYVFVDYENVHEIDHSVIGEKEVVFMLFVGASQRKLNVELVEKLLECSSTVKLIHLRMAGENALDFAIAYHVGRITASDPAGKIHIISRDRGFDPLLSHLSSNGIVAVRHTCFADLSLNLLPELQSDAPEDPFETVLSDLEKHPLNRPKCREKFLNYLTARFRNRMGKAEIGSLVDKCQQRGVLSFDEKGAIIYPS